MLGQRDLFCFEKEANCCEVRKVDDDDDDDNGDDDNGDDDDNNNNNKAT